MSIVKLPNGSIRVLDLVLIEASDETDTTWLAAATTDALVNHGGAIPVYATSPTQSQEICTVEDIRLAEDGQSLCGDLVGIRPNVYRALFAGRALAHRCDIDVPGMSIEALHILTDEPLGDLDESPSLAESLRRRLMNRARRREAR